ncbi:hypothetical protein C8Q73DRAFT_206594 [Cubamyces lactineus]|nr:hypothetical protein C8Q73DRAFT_206594 [Cubamyces lactineus]
MPVLPQMSIIHQSMAAGRLLSSPRRTIAPAACVPRAAPAGSDEVSPRVGGIRHGSRSGLAAVLVQTVFDESSLPHPYLIRTFLYYCAHVGSSGSILGGMTKNVYIGRWPRSDVHCVQAFLEHAHKPLGVLPSTPPCRCCGSLAFDRTGTVALRRRTLPPVANRRFDKTLKVSVSTKQCQSLWWYSARTQSRTVSNAAVAQAHWWSTMFHSAGRTARSSVTERSDSTHHTAVALARPKHQFLSIRSVSLCTTMSSLDLEANQSVLILRLLSDKREPPPTSTAFNITASLQQALVWQRKDTVQRDLLVKLKMTAHRL